MISIASFCFSSLGILGAKPKISHLDDLRRGVGDERFRPNTKTVLHPSRSGRFFLRLFCSRGCSTQWRPLSSPDPHLPRRNRGRHLRLQVPRRRQRLAELSRTGLHGRAIIAYFRCLNPVLSGKHAGRGFNLGRLRGSRLALGTC